uniref:Ig-like domain-containing protein n=1 Tax=Erpetoichthys calabaricus TaxID=27687 RepID=A0A8C4SUM9_ERPCA
MAGYILLIFRCAKCFVLFVYTFLFIVKFSRNSFIVVGPSKPVVTYVCEDVVLPASLSPALNAEAFEVNWFTTDIRSPELLYTNYRISRQSDTRRTLSIDNLKNGNVSLIIRNVHVSDEELYKCLVYSGQRDEETQVSLTVEGQFLGAQPSITMSSTEGQKTRLECSAEKWNPQPEVTWRDMNGADVTSQSTIKSEQDSEGLLRVSSVLPVKEEYNVFSCLMRSKSYLPEKSQTDVFFIVVGPSKPVVTYVGEDVVLSASLSPALNAEVFEVMWVTTDFSSPVLLYQDKRIKKQIERRKAMVLDNLKFGNVSLIITNVRVSDDDLYKSDVKVFLLLFTDLPLFCVSLVLGAQPSISMSSTEGQKTRLECSTEKWNPQPEVTWRDMNGADVTSQSTIKSERDSEGLLRVSSVLPVKEEYNVFSCLMRSKAPKPDWPSELNIYSTSLIVWY